MRRQTCSELSRCPGRGTRRSNRRERNSCFAALSAPSVRPRERAKQTGVVELLGGLARIVGLFPCLAGFGLALTMLGAIGFVHLASGFFALNGLEFPLALVGATSALTAAGAGRFSLDALIARRRAPTAGATHPPLPLPQLA